jgi:hypothetical protein
VRNSFLSDALANIIFKPSLFILSVIWWRDKNLWSFTSAPSICLHGLDLYLANSHLMDKFHGGRSWIATQRKSHNSAMVLSPGLPLWLIGGVFLHLLVYMLTIQIMNKDRDTECSFICETPGNLCSFRISQIINFVRALGSNSMQSIFRCQTLNRIGHLSALASGLVHSHSNRLAIRPA